MNVESPMGGTLWKIETKQGDAVKEGDILVILESMKMEIPIESPGDGTVKEVHFKEGDFIQENDVIITIE